MPQAPGTSEEDLTSGDPVNHNLACWAIIGAKLAWGQERPNFSHLVPPEWGGKPEKHERGSQSRGSSSPRTTVVKAVGCPVPATHHHSTEAYSQQCLLPSVMSS